MCSFLLVCPYFYFNIYKQKLTYTQIKYINLENLYKILLRINLYKMILTCIKVNTIYILCVCVLCESCST